jgi:protein PhnA
LSRRARSRCELCEDSGVRLIPTEVAPIPEEPELETTVLLCEPCAQGADDGPLDVVRWRFLEGVVWSELAPAQVLAVRLLRRLQADAPWASPVLDGLYLDPEIEAWIDAN